MAIHFNPTYNPVFNPLKTIAHPAVGSIVQLGKDKAKFLVVWAGIEHAGNDSSGCGYYFQGIKVIRNPRRKTVINPKVFSVEFMHSSVSGDIRCDSMTIVGKVEMVKHVKQIVYTIKK